MRQLVTSLIAGTFAVIGFGIPTVSAEDETKAEGHVLSSEVHFDVGSAELSATARASLDEAADWLARNPQAVIIIEGHADASGTPAVNKKLSERRAEAARAYLADRGVAAEKIQVVAYGAALPAVEGQRTERMNRRVTITAFDKEPIIEEKAVRVTERVEVPVEEKVYIPKVVEVEKRVPGARRALGIDLLAGGGVIGFIDDESRDAADIGGTWSARVAGRNHSLIGYEAAYVGSAQGIAAFMFPDARLMGSGLEGALRLNIPVSKSFQPYIFGGFGYTLYNVAGMDGSTAAMEEDDDVFHIPAGVGLRFGLPARLVLDVRGTYRAAFDDTMFDGMGGDNGLENWSTAAQLGMSF